MEQKSALKLHFSQKKEEKLHFWGKDIDLRVFLLWLFEIYDISNNILAIYCMKIQKLSFVNDEKILKMFLILKDIAVVLLKTVVNLARCSLHSL